MQIIFHITVNENAFGREFLYPLEFEEDYNITNEVLRNDSIVETGILCRI